MCHPGMAAATRQCTDPAILAYHMWEEEMEALCSERVQQTCKENRIDVVGYHDLESANANATLRQIDHK